MLHLSDSINRWWRASQLRPVRFFRTVYWDNARRPSEQRRRLAFDLARYARNAALVPLEELARRRYGNDGFPVVFIVGAPRSGTTLLHQLLATYLDVGYVSNRMARLWMTPILAAAWDRWREPDGHIELESEYGRGTGDASPHEYSWFWQYYAEFERHDDLSDDEFRDIDWRPLVASLQGLAGYHRKPVVLKSINFVNYQILGLYRLFPRARFLWIRRAAPYVAQSILRVREERYGSRQAWWSVRPRDVEAWRDRAPEEQVAYQIMDTLRAVGDAFEQLPREAGQILEYERLVAEPALELQALAAWMGASVKLPEALRQLRLTGRNQRRVDAASWHRIEQALGLQS